MADTKKKLNKLTLVGVVREWGNKSRIAKAQDADKIWYFGGREGKSIIKAFFKNKKLHVRTTAYTIPITLTLHATQGYWYGTLPNGVKIQITVLKIVAHMRYWA